MRKIILLFFFCTIIDLVALAQLKTTIQWQKCYGGSDVDWAIAIRQTSDSGYIMGGTVSSNNGDVTGEKGGYDFWAVKLDTAGNILWQKCLGGSDNDYLSSIEQTLDGGYIVAGYSLSTDGDVSNHIGEKDYWVVKLDAIGNIVWNTSLGGSKTESEPIVSQTSDGGYIVIGSSGSNDGNVIGNHGLSDCWVVKLTAAGVIDWQKCYGGTLEEYRFSVQQTTDGGYVIGGTTKSNDGDVSGNHGSTDCWVLKITSTGSIDWSKCYGGSMADQVYSIKQTADGGYILAGLTGSNNGDVTNIKGNTDSWIVKLSPNGTIEWQKTLGGSEQDFATSIWQCNDSSYIVAGKSLSSDGDITQNKGMGDYWIVKLSATGSILWQQSYGGSKPDAPFSIAQTIDKGYIVAGESSSTNGDVTGNHGYTNCWVIKLNMLNYTNGINATDNQKNIVHIYPNPVNNILHIDAGSPVYCVISGMDGRVYLQRSTGNEVNMSALPAGVYILNVYNSAGDMLLSEKITKTL